MKRKRHPDPSHTLDAGRCTTCGAGNARELRKPCIMSNGPSGLPQDDTPHGMSEAEYKAFQARIKASQAQDEADEEHDADLVWLLHCVRAVARTKKTRKQDPGAFKDAVQGLVFECSRYSKKHY